MSKPIHLLSLFLCLLTTTGAFAKICGTGKLMTIDQRIKACGNQQKKLSNGQSLSLVASIPVEQGRTFSYYRDDASGLVWGKPIFQKAQTETFKSCSDLKELDLAWALPTNKEVLRVGNENNYLIYNNPMMAEALNLPDSNYFTSSPYTGGGQYGGDVAMYDWKFDSAGSLRTSTSAYFHSDGDNGRYIYYRGDFLCVGREALKNTNGLYNPNKRCGYQNGLSVDQRIKACGDIQKKLESGQTVSLVTNLPGPKGEVSTYVRDDNEGLVWGPIVPTRMSQTKAVDYCKGLEDLGLTWHLPTREEVQAAAGKNGYAKMMFGILNTQRVYVLWTAGDGVLFNSDSGSGSWDITYSNNEEHNFICVGR